MYQEAVEQSAKEFERLFEIYKPRVTNGISRGYHPGRIYGTGQYADPDYEAEYQKFIRNPELIEHAKKLAAAVRIIEINDDNSFNNI